MSATSSTARTAAALSPCRTLGPGSGSGRSRSRMLPRRIAIPVNHPSVEKAKTWAPQNPGGGEPRPGPIGRTSCSLPESPVIVRNPRQSARVGRDSAQRRIPLGNADSGPSDTTRNTPLHTREVAGSKPAAPILKMPAGVPDPCVSVRDDDHGRRQPEHPADDAKRSRDRRRWLGESTLRNGPRYRGPAQVPVPDQRDAVERERHPEQCVGPLDRAVVERRDEPAYSDRYRECRKSGSPPCKLGALAGKMRAPSSVIRHQRFAQLRWPGCGADGRSDAPSPCRSPPSACGITGCLFGTWVRSPRRLLHEDT
jgi:hypothetical protein